MAESFTSHEFPKTLLGNPPLPPVPPCEVDPESPLEWPQTDAYSAMVLLTFEVPVVFDVSAGEDVATVAIDQAVEVVGGGHMTLVHTEILNARRNGEDHFSPVQVSRTEG